jgi:hypothetical protein
VNYRTVLLVVTLALFFALAFFPRDLESNGRLFILNPVFYSILFWCAPFVALVLPAISLFSIWRRKNTSYKILLWLSPLFVYPLALGVSIVQRTWVDRPWAVHGSASDSQGNTYFFLSREAPLMYPIALAKLESRGFLGSSFRILAEAEMKLMEPTRIIRPEGSGDSFGQVYVTSRGLVLGVAYENHCFLAYDSKTGSAYGPGAVLRLSPDVLIEDGVRPNPKDLEDLEPG